jgi:hypothetical protein
MHSMGHGSYLPVVSKPGSMVPDVGVDRVAFMQTYNGFRSIVVLHGNNCIILSVMEHRGKDQDLPGTEAAIQTTGNGLSSFKSAGL